MTIEEVKKDLMPTLENMIEQAYLQGKIAGMIETHEPRKCRCGRVVEGEEAEANECYMCQKARDDAEKDMRDDIDTGDEDHTDYQPIPA